MDVATKMADVAAAFSKQIFKDAKSKGNQ